MNDKYSKDACGTSLWRSIINGHNKKTWDVCGVVTILAKSHFPNIFSLARHKDTKVGNRLLVDGRERMWQISIIHNLND